MAGHGGARTGGAGSGMATSGPTVDGDPAAGARPAAGGRQGIAGIGGIPVSSAGNEPADERRPADGMAPLQRPGRLGKPDQGTGRTVWDQAAVRGKLLGHGSPAPSGDRRLQPVRAAATATGP